MIKKSFLMIAACIVILACGTTTSAYDTSSGQEEPSPADNVCYSEYNLTDEECKNVGTHIYAGSGWISSPCVFDDQGNTSFQETVPITVTFHKDDRVTIANASEHHYNTYEFTYSEESPNTYAYYHSGVGDGPNIKYSVVFQWWGFYEEAIPDNGECKFHAEYRLSQ